MLSILSELLPRPGSKSSLCPCWTVHVLSFISWLSQTKETCRYIHLMLLHFNDWGAGLNSISGCHTCVTPLFGKIHLLNKWWLHIYSILCVSCLWFYSIGKHLNKPKEKNLFFLINTLDNYTIKSFLNDPDLDLFFSTSKLLSKNPEKIVC